mgnify:CR=1 FL=1
MFSFNKSGTFPNPTKEEVTMTERTDSEIIAILSETPMGHIISALRTGLYPDNHQNPAVEANETVIGELTSAERALHQAAATLVARHHAIAGRNNQMVHDALQAGQEIDHLQVFLNQAEAEAMDALIAGCSKCVWFLIKNRFGETTMHADGIGIKECDQIVIRPETDEEDSTSLFAHLMALHSMVMARP